MRYKLLFILSCLAFAGYSQSPQLINYQGVARYGDGSPMMNKVLGLRFEIRSVASGSLFFTENQTVTSNALGLFSTQIGKIASSRLDTMKWNSGDVMLHVAIDTSGSTSNFINLGSQQLVSVPYALNAKAVFSAYNPTSNVISIGTSSYLLSSGITYSAGPGISITSGTLISASPSLSLLAPNTLSITGGSTLALPEYSLSQNSNSITLVRDGSSISTITLSPPSLTLSGPNNNSLTAGNNTIQLNTYTTGAGLTMNNVGNSYTISSAASNPTFIGAGIAVVNPTTGTNFTVTVPALTLVPQGAITLTNGVNSFTVSAPAQVAQTIVPQGAVTVTNGVNSFTINATAAPPQTLIPQGAVSVTNGINSFTVSAPAQVAQTIVPQGALTVTNGVNSFTVNAPAAIPQTIVPQGALTVTNGVNSFTVNAPAAIPQTIVPQGAVTVTNGVNSFTVNAPAAVPQTIVPQGAVTVTNGVNSFTVNAPAAVPQTIVPQGAVTVTNGVNSFTVNAPAAIPQTIVPQGAVTVTNGVNSFTVNAPAAIPQTIVPQGAVTVTNGVNSFTVNAPAAIPQTIVPQGAVTVTNGVNSFTVNAPAAIPQTIVPQGAVTVTNGVNSFTVNAPAAIPQTIVPQGAVTVTNGVNSFTVNAPAAIPQTIVPQGAVTVTNGVNSFTVNAPAAIPQTIVPQGAVTVTNGVNSFTVNAPAAIPQTIVPQGAVTVTNGVNSFTVDAPAAIPQTIVPQGAVTVTNGVNSFTVNAPAQVTQTIVPQGAVNVTAGVNSFTIGAASAVPQTITPQGLTQVTTGVNSFTVGVPAQTIVPQGAVTVTNGANSFTVSAPAQITQTIVAQGAISVTPGVNSFTIDAPVQAPPSLTLNGADNNVLTAGQNSVTLNTYTSGSGVSITGGPNYTISSSGGPWTASGGTVSLATPSNNVGVGVANPTAKLEVAGKMYAGQPAIRSTGQMDADANTSILGLQGITENNDGDLYMRAYWGAIIDRRGGNSSGGTATNFGDGAFAVRYKTATNTFRTDFLINDAGNIGIGNTSPSALLHLTGTFRFVDGNQAGGKVLTSDASGNATWQTATGGPWTSTGGTVSLVTPSSYVGIGTNTPTALLDIETASNTISGIIVRNGRDQVGGSIPMELQITTAGQTYGTNTFGRIVRYSHLSSGNFFDLGFSSTGNFFLSSNNNYSPPHFEFSTAGYLGIGTTPNAPLQLDNTIASRKIVMWDNLNNDHQFYGFGINTGVLRYQVDITSADHVFYAATSSVTSQELMRIGGSGRVGINNASPTATLDIVGTMKLVDGNEGNGKVLTSDASGNASWQSAAGSNWGLTGNAGSNPGTNFIGTTDNQDLVFRANNSELMRLNTSSGGRVSIGTALNSPGVKLLSTSTCTSGNITMQSNINFNPQSGAAGGLAAAGYFNNQSNGQGGGTQLNTALTGYINLTGNSTSQFNTGAWLHGITTSGYHNNLLGVLGSLEVYNSGTVQSAYGGYFFHFGVNGTIDNGYGVYIGSVQGTNRWSLYAADAAAPNYFAGKVGIGNNAPQQQLSVGSTASDSQEFTARVYTTSPTPGLWMGSAAVGGTAATAVMGQLYDRATIGGHNANLSAWADLAINPIGGNVGINTGTVAPTAALTVSGTTRFVDGSQGAGKVLTSDASGNASWMAPSTSSANICYLKDVKSSGTSGGNFTSLTWLTRDLNTVEGNTSLVTLAANQFTLQAGTYRIRIEAPAYSVNGHKAKLRNITDGADEIIGRAAFASNSYGGENISVVEGVITITSAKAFQVQHYCNVTQNANGLGGSTSMGLPEIYTQVQINKLQ